MEKIFIERVVEAVKRAKRDALQIDGIETEPELFDAVAATLAVLELTGLGTAETPIANEAESVMALPETFAEWASHFNISTHYDRILAMMVYLHKNGKTSVTTSDIIGMYDKARWEKPANVADFLAKGAQRMLFTEAENTEKNESSLKLWRITRTGHSYFQSLKYEE